MLEQRGKDVKWIKDNAATKDDIVPKDHIATKDDLKRIYGALNDHEIRLNRIEENMATKQDLAAMSETLDQILVNTTRDSQEIAMTHRAIARHDKNIENIYKRMDAAHI